MPEAQSCPLARRAITSISNSDTDAISHNSRLPANKRCILTASLALFSHQVSSRGSAAGRGYAASLTARDRGLRRRSCGFAAGLDEYVEEPEGAQRSRHA